MVKHSYKPKGVCSVLIEFETDDEKRIHNLKYTGGCNGNLKVIGKLVEGMEAEKVADLLEGNTCGFKNTSCADQLAKAIRSELG